MHQAQFKIELRLNTIVLSAPKDNILISSEITSELFSILENIPALALAVSGGADSLALLYLYNNWRKEFAPTQRCMVLTVDHQLRENSTVEAKGVAEICRKIGVSHKILVWDEEKPTSNIQSRAREKRYALMESEMTKAGIKYLLLAHHKDDQAETFLNRLARGSSVYGLASMAMISAFGRIKLIRPLLDISKEQLIATLKAVGWSWYEDQSNFDQKYLRSRIRKLIPDLENVGITVEGLAETAKRMQRVVNALNFATENLLNLAVEQHPAGPLKINVKLIRDAPQEIVLRLLSKLICAIGGNKYVPRFEKLEKVYLTIMSEGGQNFKAITIGGVQFCVDEQDSEKIWLFREYGNGIEKRELNPGESCFWDNRFQIELAINAPNSVNVCTLRDHNATEEIQTNIPIDWPNKIFQTAPVLMWTCNSKKGNQRSIKPNSHACIPGLTNEVPNWLVIERRSLIQSDWDSVEYKNDQVHC